ncbi:MAG: hypothetical protein KBD62_37860 [Kofleriaceae bacterium]|nr:hypothetical protein [Kofleriaceae bacterium]
MSNLAWIDLETTGLDPDVHDILEKERAEKAERCSLALDDTVARQGERVAHEGTRSMLDCERHGHDLTKAWRDRLRNEPHLIEAGQTKYDADVWRARCLDAEAKMGAELDRPPDLFSHYPLARRITLRYT